MLGLGVGFYKLAGNDYPGGEFAPDQIENLALWLRFNTDVQGTDGEGTAITSQTSPYPDGETISQWSDQSGNNNHAVQGSAADRPLFEADEPGALFFASAGGNAKYMDLKDPVNASNIQIDANTNFTIIVRFKATNFSSKVLLGSNTDEFLRLNNNRTFRIKIGSASTDKETFQEASGTIMETDTYYTVMLVRSNGDGTMKVYVRGGAYTTASGKDWDASEPSTKLTNQLDIDNIGSSADDTENFQGYMKDVIIYDGTALTAAQRELVFDYIESQ